MSYKISIIKRAKAFAKFLAKGDFEKVGKEEYRERLRICLKCDKYNPNGYLGYGKCEACGCSKLKLEFKNQKCVKGKW